MMCLFYFDGIIKINSEAVGGIGRPVTSLEAVDVLVKEKIKDSGLK